MHNLTTTKTITVEMLSPEGKTIWAALDYICQVQKIGAYYTSTPEDHDDFPERVSIIGDREWLGDVGSDSLWVDTDGALWMRKHFRQAHDLASVEDIAAMRREADAEECSILLNKAIKVAELNKLPGLAALQAALSAIASFAT